MFLRQTIAVFLKDLRSEYRERTAISAIVLFAVTSVFVVGFSLAGVSLSPEAAAPMLWIVLFFSAFSGLAHVFTHEEEGGTALPLRLAAQPEAILMGKLTYNLALLAAVACLVGPLFVLVTDLHVTSPGRLAAVIASGSFSLSASATIVGAIVAKARARGALFGALGFPVVLPLLMLAVASTRRALGVDASEWSWARDIGGLLGYGIMTVAASVLVFPVLWESD